MNAKNNQDIPNFHFMSLVYSLSQTIMSQLGKIANPVTGKVDVNLTQAKATIDMLDMIKEKTKGNLTDSEEKMILTTLQNLYLNYADEAKKSSQADSQETKQESHEKETIQESGKKE